MWTQEVVIYSVYPKMEKTLRSMGSLQVDATPVGFFLRLCDLGKSHQEKINAELLYYNRKYFLLLSCVNNKQNLYNITQSEIIERNNIKFN